MFLFQSNTCIVFWFTCGQQVDWKNMDNDNFPQNIVRCDYLSVQWRLGPVFSLLLGVSSDYAQPITGQVTEVTWPVIGQAQPELTPSKRQRTGPACCVRIHIYSITHSFEALLPPAKTDRLINHDKWTRTAWRCLVSSGQTKLTIEVQRNLAIPRPSSLVSCSPFY